MYKRFLKLFACVLFILNLIFFLYIFFFPVNKTRAVFELSSGEVLFDVTNKLYNQKIINSKFLFKLWFYLTWNQNKLKVGEYIIPNGASVNTIKNLITSGFLYNKYIVIPEGLTVKQIIELMDSYEDLSGTVSVNINEGELFPDTYSYNKTVSKNDLILKMKKLMQENLNREWQNRDPNLPFNSMNDAIILASIVEKETGLAEERGLVASVFINRLNKKMRLQSDPTVIYTLTNKYGNMKGKKLYSKHLQILTSYNTYKIKGLPVGAICNPGLESIKAVLHPLKTEYLYFVADGSGGHKFAKTLEEHEKNRKEWQDFKKKNE